MTIVSQGANVIKGLVASSLAEDLLSFLFPTLFGRNRSISVCKANMYTRQFDMYIKCCFKLLRFEKVEIYQQNTLDVTV